MMQPASDNDCIDGLLEMAEHVADMTTTLEDIVERLVRGLARTDATDSLYDDVMAIRDMESRCDAIKYDVIATAFADETIEHPLMYRELAILFDDLDNTMEDVTHRIILIASDETGIVTEIDLADEE